MKDRIRKAYEEYQQRGLLKFPSCTLYLGDTQDILDIAKGMPDSSGDILFSSIIIAFEAGVVMGLRKGQTDERKRQNEARKKSPVSR